MQKHKLGALVFAALAVTSAATAATAKGLFYADEIAIYDATGKKVGAVQATQAHTFPALASVVYRSGTRPVIVHFLRGEIRTDALHFATSDCSGRPFVESGGSPGYAYPATAVAGSRRTVYLQAGEFGRRTMRSTRSPGDECLPGAVTGVFAPLTSSDIHLGDLFTAPFAARPRGTTAVPVGAP